jgi:hypothetical protein
MRQFCLLRFGLRRVGLQTYCQPRGGVAVDYRYIELASCGHKANLNLMQENYVPAPPVRTRHAPGFCKKCASYPAGPGGGGTRTKSSKTAKTRPPSLPRRPPSLPPRSTQTSTPRLHTHTHTSTHTYAHKPGVGTRAGQNHNQKKQGSMNGHSGRNGCWWTQAATKCISGYVREDYVFQ